MPVPASEGVLDGLYSFSQILSGLSLAAELLNASAVISFQVVPGIVTESRLQVRQITSGYGMESVGANCGCQLTLGGTVGANSKRPAVVVAGEDFAARSC